MRHSTHVLVFCGLVVILVSGCGRTVFGDLPDAYNPFLPDGQGFDGASSPDVRPDLAADAATDGTLPPDAGPADGSLDG
jgi:hypothetical protein